MQPGSRVWDRWTRSPAVVVAGAQRDACVTVQFSNSPQDTCVVREAELLVQEEVTVPFIEL